MISEQQRHRVLAGLSRSRLLAVLRRTAVPMAVRDLAAEVGLHPNTAREHLDALVGAGLVERQAATPSGRGRPGLRYRAAPTEADDPKAYRALARVLADALSQRPDATVAATRAGEGWGRVAARSLAGAAGASGATAMDGLIELLDDAGFAPGPPSAPGEPIRLHRCPFRPLARDRRDVVCGVHLGLMRGALAELGAPYDQVRLEPFVEPSLCLAHVGGARLDR